MGVLITNLNYCAVLSVSYLSAEAGQNVFRGPNLQNLGDLGENPQKIFEIFIPEITANRSNFRH